MRHVRRPIALLIALVFGAGCHTDPGYKGRPSEAWIAQLAEPGLDQRIEAATALGEVLRLQPNAPKVVTALVAALADTSDPVRVAAASAIRHAGRGGRRVREQLERDAVPAIAALLADSAHPAVRTQAVAVLRDFGPDAAPTSAPALAGALADPDPFVRRPAADALGALGEAARPVVQRIIAATRDADFRVRRAAARALALVGGPPATVGPALAAALRDTVELVREAAAEGMGERGADGLREWTAPSAGDPLGALRAVATRDQNPRVRIAAVTALGLLGDAGSRRALRQARTDSDPTVRREAEHALSAVHRRGGEDVEGDALPEPSRVEVCKSNPRARGC
jgi:HEAT repeat protein